MSTTLLTAWAGATLWYACHRSPASAGATLLSGAAATFVTIPCPQLAATVLLLTCAAAAALAGTPATVPLAAVQLGALTRLVAAAALATGAAETGWAAAVLAGVIVCMCAVAFLHGRNGAQKKSLGHA